MKLSVRYLRVFALAQTQSSTPPAHPASPISLKDFPAVGLTSEIHIGRVPDDMLYAMQCHRAFLKRAFTTGFKDASELQREAALIADQEILVGPGITKKVSRDTYWFVTLVVNDHLEIKEDPTQLLYGVDVSSWSRLDESDFFEKHMEALDLLATHAGVAVAPQRLRWRCWDGPVVPLPTGISLKPLQFRGGRVRAFSAPALERMDLSRVAGTIGASPLGFHPMVSHFYMRASIESDRVARFFDAFRTLEVICTGLAPSFRRAAQLNGAKIAAKSPTVVNLVTENKDTLRMKFAILVLALNPGAADSDMDRFSVIYDWRNDLVHGKRRLRSDDAPDEEAFELVERYLKLLANSV